ncbi:hypothetical protein J2S43_004358 [Catenuloplanes nepalensis]|uniref:Uncharacterized protein n=1 Tax=Catenuloplanes nepalensis TaxID=587533 RepID=A0ABT9MXU2_9ACTN|nr:hypothetical protein [Catenuloplanes nepalensis]MDP9795846.1 hypothetical protein [Catenuloplanes nepalensis]
MRALAAVPALIVAVTAGLYIGLAGDPAPWFAAGPPGRWRWSRRASGATIASGSGCICTRIPPATRSWAACERSPRSRASTIAIDSCTSHFTLRFSDSVVPWFRWAKHCPAVEPRLRATDRFVVRTPDGRLHDETGAPGALRIVLASLPSAA